METSSHHDDAGKMAAQDLASVDDVRREFASSLRVPPWYDFTSGTAAGLNVAAVGLVFGGEPTWRVGVGGLLLLVSLVSYGWSERRFRAANGAWVSGVRKGRTLLTSIAGSIAQAVLGFAAAVAAISAGWWWFGLVLAPVQVIIFVVVSRRWMRIYRAEHGA